MGRMDAFGGLLQSTEFGSLAKALRWVESAQRLGRGHLLFVGAHRESPATFTAPILKDILSTPGFHPLAKTMSSAAADLAGLESAFHGVVPWVNELGSRSQPRDRGQVKQKDVSNHQILALIGEKVRAMSFSLMRDNIRLVSTAGTGFTYYTTKNKRTQTSKLELKKYDPKVRKHVIFKEQKMPPHSK